MFKVMKLTVLTAENVRKPSSVRKKKRPSKTSLARKKGLILENITQTEFDAPRLLVDNLRK